MPLVAVLTLALCASATPAGWRLFRSRDGFTVRYPSSWVRFGEPARLALRSSPGGAEGVIIKAGQAYLWVAAEDSAAGRPLDAVIARYTAGADTVLTRRAVATDSATGACPALAEVVTREPIVPREGALAPVRDVLNDEYFCAAGGRVVVATMRFYAADPRGPAYRAVARRVARSIRVAR